MDVKLLLTTQIGNSLCTLTQAPAEIQVAPEVVEHGATWVPARLGHETVCLRQFRSCYHTRKL